MVITRYGGVAEPSVRGANHSPGTGDESGKPYGRYASFENAKLVSQHKLFSNS